LYFPDRDDMSGAVFGALFALAAAAVGLAAIAHVRPLPRRTVQQYATAAALVLLLGVALGAANLGVNYTLSLLDPIIHQQMAERWEQYSDWSMLVADPFMEELAFRLFIMGTVAWLVARFTDNRKKAFWIALITSALLFGLIHIVGRPPMPVDTSINVAYSVGVVVKSAGAGLFLGWVFWRWGLPYSYACHSIANATHLLLAPSLF
jgi:membrane protease YdiL (CAAX protease family)